MYCGVVPTNSLVPMHAAISFGEISIAKRRDIQALAALRNASLPMLAGYPRSLFDEDNAATTAANGGSHGVPMERSMTPPSKARPNAANASRRSYGYGGGTKPEEELIRLYSAVLMGVVATCLLTFVATTYGRNRPTEASPRRARTRAPVSSWAVDTTSPSRCTMANASPWS